MLGAILGAMLLLSVTTGAMAGRMNQVSAAAMTGCEDAVTLAFSLAGTICLWSGVMRVADGSGVTTALARLLQPVTRRLFRELSSDTAAMGAISMNLAANLLGLGNAATPLGLRAMKELDRAGGYPARATQAMITFVVLNTASLQLLPTTNAFLRLEAGSKAPMEILPAVWAASAASVTVGVVAAFILKGRKGKRGKCG